MLFDLLNFDQGKLHLHESPSIGGKHWKQKIA